MDVVCWRSVDGLVHRTQLIEFRRFAQVFHLEGPEAGPALIPGEVATLRRSACHVYGEEDELPVVDANITCMVCLA